MDQPLIVLTTDFSDESARAYAQTADLAKRLGGSILLLHVISSLAIPAHGAPFAPMQDEPDASAHLTEAKKALEKEKAKVEAVGPGVSVDTHAEATTADIAEAVAAVAEQRSAMMIACSTHGRTGLRRLVLGSVAEAIVRHAKCPVLTFPDR